MRFLLQAAPESPGSGLVLLFVFIVIIGFASAAGYFLGGVLGRTEGGNLRSALALARTKLESTGQRLRATSTRLVGLDKSARLAGDALVIATKATGLAEDVASVERRAAASEREAVQ